MLKQVTNRRYSKSSKTLLIVLMILAIIAVLVLTLSRPPKKPVETTEPLGVYTLSDFRVA